MNNLKHITVFLFQLLLLQTCVGDTELITQPQEVQQQKLQSEAEPLTSAVPINVDNNEPISIAMELARINSVNATKIASGVSAFPRSIDSVLAKNVAPFSMVHQVQTQQQNVHAAFKDNRTAKKPMFYKIIKKIEYGSKPKIQRRSYHEHRVIVRPTHQHSALPVKFFIKPNAYSNAVEGQRSVANANKAYLPVVPAKHEYKFPPALQSSSHQSAPVGTKWTSTVTLPNPNPYNQYSHSPSTYHQFNQFAGSVGSGQSYKKIPSIPGNSYVSYKATIPKYQHKAPVHQYSPAVVAASPTWSHTPPQWQQQSYDSFSPSVSYKTPTLTSQHASGGFEGFPESNVFAPYKQEYQHASQAQYAVDEPTFEEPIRQPKYYMPKAPAQPAPMPPPSMTQFGQHPAHDFQNYVQPAEMAPAPEIDYSSYQLNGDAQAHKMNYPSLAAIQQFSSSYLREEMDGKQTPQYQYTFGNAEESPQHQAGLGAHASGHDPWASKPQWDDQAQWYTEAAEEQPHAPLGHLQQAYAWRQKTQDGNVIQVSQHQNAQESRPEVVKVPLVQPQQYQPQQQHELVRKQVSDVSDTEVIQESSPNDVVKTTATGQQENMIANGWTPIINSQ